EVDVALRAQVGSDGLADVALVPQHLEIRMARQQLLPNRQVGQIGGGQFQVADDAAGGDGEMEFVAKDRLRFRAAMPEGGPSDLPVAARMGHIIELDHGNRQAINDTMRVLRAVEDLQDGLAHQIDDLRQITAAAIEAAAIEAAACGLMGEEVTMCAPVAEQ